MIQGERIVAIIPAKKVSRRLPGKNLKLLRGKPLVYYSICVALKSHLLDEIFVSTDSDTIAAVSKEYGASVIPRPAELAVDDVTNFEVMIHALEWIKENKSYYPTYLMLLQPTYPLRFPHTLDEAVRCLMDNQSFDSLVTVKKIQDAWGKIMGNRFLPAYVLPSPKNEREPIYFLTHSVYLLRSATTLEKGVFLGEKILPLVETVPFEVDINTTYDFDYAEFILQKYSDQYPYLDLNKSD
jgi:CMP-N,N'-diacetyllegionaminic acid synthase